jgi:hypothetical protein
MTTLRSPTIIYTRLSPRARACTRPCTGASLTGNLSKFTESGFVKHHCDYTGLPLVFASTPQALPLEAPYHYATKEDGRLAYHAMSNVRIAADRLDLFKCKSPIITLPLLSSWLKVYDEGNTITIREQMPRLLWIYNALSNTAVMHNGLGLSRHNRHLVSE